MEWSCPEWMKAIFNLLGWIHSILHPLVMKWNLQWIFCSNQTNTNRMHKRISMNTIGSTHLRLNQLIDFIVYDSVKAFFFQKLDRCFAVVIISPAKDYQSKVLSQINLSDVSVNKNNFWVISLKEYSKTDLSRSSVWATMPRSSLATENFTAFSME